MMSESVDEEVSAEVLNIGCPLPMLSAEELISEGVLTDVGDECHFLNMISGAIDPLVKLTMLP
jgi:hypothetical protein